MYFIYRIEKQNLVTLHCGKLMDMFKKFYKEHGQNEPRCELLCNWNTNNCQKWGLSWHLRLKTEKSLNNTCILYTG
jgi:hypothetical protein